jgi:glycosyltransferase involved in cell wall biosynthesis
MKISFIICTLNSVKRLSKTLDSILKQESNDFEVVIIDGSSTDGTVELVGAYEDKFAGKLTWVSKNDKGIYDAMNKGIRMARGEFLNFIGAGDWLENGSLERVFDCMKNNPNADAIYGMTRIWNGNMSINRTMQTLPETLPSQPMQHPAIFYRKILHKKFGFYDENYKIVSDYAFCLKVFYFGKASVALLDHIIANFVIDGISSKRRILCLKENASVRRASGFKTNFPKELLAYMWSKVEKICRKSVL